ncbi:hypothetical protein CBM2589_U10169 [Cupriavidus taiwanensis]|uniref:Uncharacterized protein n=1 Tax=Cupriavidus taiwanensis TaxID=164546 RepID=A0A375CQY8_9BURK|nr:hypothetical protein CBM2589_U10169 [Cupriavidus taiwanensis]
MLALFLGLTIRIPIRPVSYTGLLGDLKLHRSMGFLLSDCGSGGHVIAVAYVLDQQSSQIASSERSSDLPLPFAYEG